MRIKQKLKENISRDSSLYKFFKFASKVSYYPLIDLRKKILLKKFKRPDFKKMSVGENNFSLFIDSKNGLVDELIFLNDIYDEGTTRVILENLEVNSTFLDVGSNIGYFTNLAASICQKGKVYAFEPIKDIYNQSIRSINKNGFKNVKVFNLGCGDKNEEKEIYISNDNVGGSSAMNLKEKKGFDSKEKISLVRIDDLINERVDLIKLDVEGYEYFAFLGMEKLLRKYLPKIIFEFSPYYYESFEKGMSLKILSFLTSIGYSMIDLEDNKKITDFKEYMKKFNLNTDSHSNIYCMKG